MNVEHPDHQCLSETAAADQSIVNPQARLAGKPGILHQWPKAVTYKRLQHLHHLR